MKWTSHAGAWESGSPPESRRWVATSCSTTTRKRPTVGRFLVVVEHDVATHRRDSGGEPDSQAPACDVHFMDTLVADVAVAGVPEPVPVVMETVHGETAVRRRP